jgi:eukaryotic-like serine/threonine-protein kinase
MFHWLTQYFRPSEPGAQNANARLTFGASSVARSASRTGLFLSKQLWIRPIIAVVLLGAIGFGIRVAIERTMKESLHSELETLLNVQRSMLEAWLKIQESNAQSLANDKQVRELASQIMAANSSPSEDAQALQARFTQELKPGMSAHNFIRYLLADKQQRIIATNNPELLGQSIPQYDSVIRRALEGQVVVSAPFPSVALSADARARASPACSLLCPCATTTPTSSPPSRCAFVPRSNSRKSCRWAASERPVRLTPSTRMASWSPTAASTRN